MRLAEDGSKGHGKNLFVEIVADMHDPVAPILGSAQHGQRPYDAGGVVARLDQVSHGGAALIDQHRLRIGAVEIELSHVPPPVKANRAVSIAAPRDAEYSDEIRESRLRVT